MNNKAMFCFQCEQTAQGRGCSLVGVCGKKPETAELQDQLTSLLISLATVSHSQIEGAEELVIKGLFMTLTNVNFDNQSLLEHIEKIKSSVAKAGVELPAFSMSTVWQDDEDIRSLKSLILFGLRGMAAYAYQAATLGAHSPKVNKYFFEALALLNDCQDLQVLLAAVLRTGEVNLECMELLDNANRSAFGVPEPTSVTMDVKKGPFIVISGHDLLDLQELLKQTEGLGINVYTHGEMLPAHAYPELHKYKHLQGNFGTAWQNQRREFEALPAPIVFTTNCIMPPANSYLDRVFTTGPVAFPGTTHLGGDRDFSSVIAKAQALGGFSEDRHFTGINGGSQLTVGFAKDTVLAAAPAIIEAVKTGKISHFFLVGGCDGAKPGRSYYTEFVEKTPKDSLILTLACGKYRFNDLDLGTVAGFPRILDMGQCNDAYSAIKVAAALAEAFSCGLNDLPLSLVLSWYEQKAVCILLTLLYLGMKNILLGHSLPAFVSPGVLKILVDKYQIAPISNVDDDLAKILHH